MRIRVDVLTLISLLGLGFGLAGGKGKPGGGGSTGVLQTSFTDTANFQASGATFTDGDPGVSIGFGQGDYKLTLRSDAPPLTVVIADPGSICPDLVDPIGPDLVTDLRFLRVDDISGLGTPDATMTTAYAQINSPWGILNLHWGNSSGSDSVDASRDADGAWSVSTRAAEQALLQVPKPGARNGWSDCGLVTAAFQFVAEAVAP